MVARGRRLSLLALGVTGVLLTALTAGCTPGGQSVAEQTSFCWGTLSRGDVAQMSVRPLKQYASDDDDLKNRHMELCSVGERGDKGEMRDKEFTLVLGRATEPSGVWQMADDIAGVSHFRGAIEGVTGWVNWRMAGVLLPSSCRKPLRMGESPYLRIEANNKQQDTWTDGKLQERMASVLMKAATRLTEKLGCSSPSFTVPKSVSKLLEPRPLDPAAACGLPGFAPLRPSAPAAEEYVTPGDATLWSCAIRFPDAPNGVVNFTVTQDPQFLWFFRNEEPGQTVLTCDGRPTLLQTGRFLGTVDKSGDVYVRPDKELYANFEKAVRDSPLC